MKVIIAPDSFKGSLSAVEVCNSIAKGVSNVFPDAAIVKIPIADGGEGTVEALVTGSDGVTITKEVTGPLGEKVIAQYGVINRETAVIEMAAASGLPLVTEAKRNPLITTTYGTGQLIKAALDAGFRKIMIGIGGSATNDGGMGMAQALGYSFRDAAGKELGFGGAELGRLAVIDDSLADQRLQECELTVACDVTNPLCGPTGAAAIYGPQKGATPEMIKVLDANLRHLAQVIKEQLGIDLIDLPGAGAAGGLGAGLVAFGNGKIKSGIETILNAVELEKHLTTADLVITGEGRIDRQSAFGKVPVGVAQRAKKYNIPVLAIAGGIGEGAEVLYQYGIDGIMSLFDKAMSLQEAMQGSSCLLEAATERALMMVKIGMELKR